MENFRNLRIIILKDKPTTPIESGNWVFLFLKDISRERFTETVLKGC